MANLHALKDQVIRDRNVLIVSLNNLHEEDKDIAFDAYLDTLEAIEKYFKGSKPDLDEPVNEQSPGLS